MTLKTQELAVRYGSRVAVQPMSLELGSTGFVALVGPNGAGKSSLLKALAGLTAYDGTVSWAGVSLANLSSRQRARSVAYLPQAQTIHWPLLARDLVALGRLAQRTYGTAASGADREAIEWAMEQTATTDFAERGVDQLSIGERARVLLARALTVRAPVLLVDEPIAMLDPHHQLQIMAMLHSYAAGSAPGSSPAPAALVVAVLHDLTLAARFCNRVLLMSDGVIVNDDVPERALDAAAVRRHYRVEPFVTRHDDEPVIVPWRPVGN